MKLTFNFNDHNPITRVRGITRSVSGQRWEGNGFDAKLKQCHS